MKYIDLLKPLIFFQVRRSTENYTIITLNRNEIAEKMILCNPKISIKISKII